MSSSKYSEKIQLNILDGIIADQETDNPVNQDTPMYEWNYTFLRTQGYIVQEFGTTDLWGRPVESDPQSGITSYERVTDKGKAWRAELYKRQNPSEFQTKKYLTSFVPLVVGAAVILLLLVRCWWR